MVNSEHNLPAGVEWNAVIECVVTRHAPFGVFVRTEHGYTGIIERIQMERGGLKTPADYPQLSERISARVIGYRSWNQQIELALISHNGKREQ